MAKKGNVAKESAVVIRKTAKKGNVAKASVVVLNK
jgi:hypothetical protein